MTQRYAHHCVDSLRRGVEAFGAVRNLSTVGGLGVPTVSVMSFPLFFVFHRAFFMLPAFPHA